MDKTACAITGHRPKSFPWKYDEGNPNCVLLKEFLAAQISKLVDRSVTDWFSGMALGVDIWSAEIVLFLRKNNPALRIHCILPCEGQEDKWSVSEQERYHAVLRRADEVFYVNRAYGPKCMLERNRYMVDHASILLAVYNGVQRSGTGATIRYAQRLGREIVVINPMSRTVIYESQRFV